jgi:hypothetical protein
MNKALGSIPNTTETRKIFAWDFVVFVMKLSADAGQVLYQ